jgi:Xaa-Pro dipeptidase
MERPFPREELGLRLAAVRLRMDERGLDAIVTSTPEDICDLTGLDHWGMSPPTC